MDKIYLIRHGETIWSKSGKHTSFTDLELTETGVLEAASLKCKLPNFDHVFVSPLKRARQTAEILNLNGAILKELLEWNYGIYEGKTTKEIQQNEPDWSIFTHGALFGETLLEIEKRVNLVLNHLQSLNGTICIVSSGHFLRALITNYLDLPIGFGKHISLHTGSLTVLGKERNQKVIETLNVKPD